MPSPTRDLAHFISHLAYDDLPAALRSSLKKLFLDIVGCGLYGITTRSGRILA